MSGGMKYRMRVRRGEPAGELAAPDARWRTNCRAERCAGSSAAGRRPASSGVNQTVPPVGAEAAVELPVLSALDALVEQADALEGIAAEDPQVHGLGRTRLAADVERRAAEADPVV